MGDARGASAAGGVRQSAGSRRGAVFGRATAAAGMLDGRAWIFRTWVALPCRATKRAPKAAFSEPSPIGITLNGRAGPSDIQRVAGGTHRADRIGALFGGQGAAQTTDVDVDGAGFDV